MFTRNLSTSCEFVPLIQYATAAPAANMAITPTTAMIVDTAGYQSVTLVCITAKAPAANTPILSAGYSANATNTTFTSFATNTTVTVGLNTTCQVLELARPSQRYIAPIVTGGAAAVQSNSTVIAILTGREPQELGGGNPLDNMNPINPAFNTTTGTFPGQMVTSSQLNTPTSKLLVANP